MEFFKKRSGAILVFFAVVILSSIFAANRSLGGRVREINDMFSEGVYGLDGYRLPSIKRQLEERGKASNLLVGVGLNYPEASTETEALREARTQLINGLENSVGAGILYDFNQELDAAFYALHGKLETLALSERDRVTAEDALNTWKNTALLIQRSRYNETVREFNREVLSVFPTNLVMKFAFVDPPELFE